MAAGLDDSWDLQHYHIVNPFELIEGRLNRDLGVAGMHSTFSPLGDLPYYIVAVKLFGSFPHLVSFLAGVPYGILAWVCFELTKQSGAADSGLEAVVIALIGMSGSNLVVEIGLTLGDIPVAIFVLLALRALLCETGVSGQSMTDGKSVRELVGGLAAGCAVAWKLTAFVYPPSLMLALLVSRWGEPHLARRASAFVLGCVTGFAMLYGPWGYHLWYRYESPFYPLYNNVFHSPWAATGSSRDLRYLPRSFIQALFYPFYWLSGRPNIVEETGVKDWHFALAYLAVVILALATWRDHRANPPITGDRRVALLAVFFVTAFIAWEAMFSIVRYAAPLEAISGIIIAFAVRRLAPRKRLPCLIMVLLFLVSTTAWPGWGRVRYASGRVFAIDAPELPSHAVVAVPSVPSAYILPFLRGRDLTFVGLEAAPHTRLEQEIAARLDQASSIWVIMLFPDTRAESRLSQFSISIDRAACRDIRTHRRDWGRLMVCPAHREAH